MTRKLSVIVGAGCRFELRFLTVFAVHIPPVGSNLNVRGDLSMKPAGKAKRPSKQRQQITEQAGAEESPRPVTLARTKRLLLAALRAWELKQGIREYF